MSPHGRAEGLMELIEISYELPVYMQVYVIWFIAGACGQGWWLSLIYNVYLPASFIQIDKAL